MLSCAFHLFAVALVGAPVSEPPTPLAAATSKALWVDSPTIAQNPLALRILSGYLTLPDSGDKELHLVHSTIGVTTSLHRELALDAHLTSRTLFGDPLASMADRVGAQLRYVPSALASEQLTLGFVVKGTLGADLKWDTLGPGVGSALGGVMVGGNLGWLDWSTQLAGGWGISRRPGKGRSSELPIRAGVAANVPLGLLDAELAGEFAIAADMERPKGMWDLLGVLGLSIPLMETIRVHAAATALRTKGGGIQFGGMLAISGNMGFGDLDNDDYPDAFDACPDVAGDAQYVGCPFESSDGDPVWDRLDACPDAAGPARNAGCPIIDADGDGIPDIDDPCPDAKECPES